jgi:hypothetical protein
MSEKSHGVDQPGHDAADRPAFSVRATLCGSAQRMLGEGYVQGGVRRTFCSSSFPFRITAHRRRCLHLHALRPDRREAQRDDPDARPDERDLLLRLPASGPFPSNRCCSPANSQRGISPPRPRAFGPRTDAEPTRLPSCANFADLTVDSPGTYYSGLATADIELCRAPFLVARQHSPNGQTARAH